MKASAVPFTKSERTRLLFDCPQRAAFFAWGKIKKARKGNRKKQTVRNKGVLWQNSIL